MKQLKTILALPLRSQYLYLMEKCKDCSTIHHDQNNRYSYFMTKYGLFSFRGSIDFYATYEANFLAIEELREQAAKLGVLNLTASTMLDNLDYVSLHNHDLEKRIITAGITHISVMSSEYMDKTNGNMYFSSRISVWTLDGELHILKVPFTYGHGSNIEHTCFNRIKQVFTSIITDSDNFSFYCRENGIKLNMRLIENCKYKDLYHG